MPFAQFTPAPFPGRPFALTTLTDAVAATTQWLMHMDMWPWAGPGIVRHQPCSLWMQGRRGGQGEPNPKPPVPEGSEFEPRSYHQPVLPAQVLHFLQPEPGKFFLDATLGGGGHSELLLQAGAQVVALDQDAEALAHARQRLRGYSKRFFAIQANFREFPTLLEEAGIGKLDGILADLGVSSRQLDSAARGFSFSQDGLWTCA
jgi:16S rRNA (cytosine1402-N4)-methyltransferase